MLEKEMYICWNTNNEEREKSSSGGIFVVLMKKVLEEQGVIFGACFDKNWKVKHDFAENFEDAKKFLRSKYVQSSMGNMYTKAKTFLENGRIVLFSGTPCQIAGLKRFLGKEYETLITVDFICHGVPSPLIWKNYLDEISEGKTIKDINFRDKSEGWKLFSLKVSFEDGTYYQKNQKEDTYIRGFLRDIYLRPCCYNCRFKGIDRISDITIADCWGIENIDPEFFDDRGTSFVMIHSRSGKKIWNSISSEMKYKRTNSQQIFDYNPNTLSSVKKPNARNKFFKNVKNPKKRIQKYIRISVFKRIIRKIKKISKKVCRR